MPGRASYSYVVETAKTLKFTMYRSAGQYYVLCDWQRGNESVAMFDDSPIGDDDAVSWMYSCETREEKTDRAAWSADEKDQQNIRDEWREYRNEGLGSGS